MANGKLRVAYRNYGTGRTFTAAQSGLAEPIEFEGSRRVESDLFFL
jgi:hypothetical protein